MNNDWLVPERLDVPDDGAAKPMRGVGAVMTTRRGGASVAPFDTMNLGVRVGDDAGTVAANRRAFASSLRAEPVFLHQVHGARVVRLDHRHVGPYDHDTLEADASFTTEPGIACTIQVADCMPVLIAARDASVVGAAHAGWRGAADGVVEKTVVAMCEAARVQPADLAAWMGPCIGPDAFEVGADVLAAFPDDARCFAEAPRADGTMRWRADLPAIVRDRLTRLGIPTIGGGAWCTFSDARRFYSYRRDGRTGRHAAAVWIRAS